MSAAEKAPPAAPQARAKYLYEDRLALALGAYERFPTNRLALEIAHLAAEAGTCLRARIADELLLSRVIMPHDIAQAAKRAVLASLRTGELEIPLEVEPLEVLGVLDLTEARAHDAAKKRAPRRRR